jgi:DNA-binding response OmpR family regulator
MMTDMKKKVFIIDDDAKLISLLTQFFTQFDLDVSSAVHPDDGINRLKRDKFDILILDVMLPDKNGFAVCREIRQFSEIPIIMLTARGEVTDRIVGLELGADDYLSKPFEPRELLARIQSVLRRSNEVKQHNRVAKFGDLEIDFDSRSVTLSEKPLDLTTMEFEALALFANNPGKTLSRDEIMDQLKGIDWEAFNRSIDVLISRLRQKLKDDPKKPKYFKTVWGSGYLFVAGLRKDKTTP